MSYHANAAQYPPLVSISEQDRRSKNIKNKKNVKKNLSNQALPEPRNLISPKLLELWQLKTLRTSKDFDPKLVKLLTLQDSRLLNFKSFLTLNFCASKILWNFETLSPQNCWIAFGPKSFPNVKCFLLIN